MMARISTGAPLPGAGPWSRRARSRRSARAASSTSRTNRQPSTTTSTRCRPSRSGGAERRRRPRLGRPTPGLAGRTSIDGHGRSPGSAVSGAGRDAARRDRSSRPPVDRRGPAVASPRRSGRLVFAHRQRRRSRARRLRRRGPRRSQRRCPIRRSGPSAPPTQSIDRSSPAQERRVADQPRSNGSVVWMPLTSTSSSARRSRVDRRRAVRADGQQLGDHRVVVRRDAHPRLDAGVDADARPRRHRPATDASWCRREARDRGPRPRCATSIAWRVGVGAAAAAASTARDSGRPAAIHSCSRDEVEVGHQLGHAVLDLEPRVDLEEPRTPSGSNRNSAVAALRRPAARRGADASSWSCGVRSSRSDPAPATPR